ncbi:MAG: sigma-70 family RNA polymerase sigma factor [Roseiflexaceae bacterium]|nr:sigma-70 family RNA polymerase sigma factor [Roseiflexaceae bacterium]
MTERVDVDQNLHKQCRAVVTQIMMRHGWNLLDYDEYVRRVVACLETGEITEPRHAAINVYCCCLYSTCLGIEGSDRQERAFIELQQYLYEISFREARELVPDLRWDIINETLLRIWEKRHSYYKPGAFLAVAAMELHNVLRPCWSRPAPALSIESDDYLPLATEAGDPVTAALDREFQERVRACFDEVLRRQPRARQQLEAVWLKYIADVDDETIGAYMAKPVASIHVLRSRGLNQLRSTPAWQSMAQELGLLA